jgi:hypothetical protein
VKTALWAERWLETERIKEMDDLRILKIIEYPTVINAKHESLYRSYHILDLVEILLQEGTPPRIALAILRELRLARGKTEEE